MTGLFLEMLSHSKSIIPSYNHLHHFGLLTLKQLQMSNKSKSVSLKITIYKPPYRDCTEEVQFKNFIKHCLTNDCAIDLKTIEEHNYVEGQGLSLPYVLTRKFSWDGNTDKLEPLYNIQDEGVWRLMMFTSQDRIFFLSFTFSATRQAFVIFIMIPDISSEAEKYTAKIWLEEPECVNPMKLSFEQKVVSLDDLKDIEVCDPDSQYLVIPYEEMKPFFLYTRNEDSDIYPDENGKFTIAVPFAIEEIKNTSLDNM